MYTIHNTTGDSFNGLEVGKVYKERTNPKDKSLVYKFAKAGLDPETKKPVWEFKGWTKVDDWKAEFEADTEAFEKWVSAKRIRIQAEINGSGSGPTKSQIASALNAVIALTEQKLSGEITEEQFAAEYAKLKQ